MTAPTLLAQPEHHGLVEHMPFPDYLAVQALSASSARKLLPPSCPALFRQDQLEPRATDRMDLGKVAHAVVLEGADVAAVVVEVDADDWRTKAAREARDQARAEGKVAMLPKDVEVVRSMAAAILRNPMAAALFDPGSGKPEVSLFWQDERSGAARKGRLDMLPERRPSGRLLIPDYKTAASAEQTEWGRSAMTFSYHQQAAAYEEGLRALDIDDDPQVLFVVQETRAPYLVTVNELDADAMSIARELNRWACTQYARCIETGVWPGHCDDAVQQVSLPGWYVRQYEEMTK